jgi:restriction endonuclease S subunit
MDDILVRLSAPYTAIMITREEWCDYLVPSHFAIIRVDKKVASPEYILWFLRRESTKQKILQNISGSGAFGTINSKFFSTLSIRSLPLKKQKTIGQMQILSEKEQELLHKLTAQKEIYNKLLIDKIYDSVKRGN